MLRPSLLKDINYVLNSHGHINNDFNIDEDQKEEQITLQINYRYDETYFMVVNIPDHTTTIKKDYSGTQEIYQIDGSVSPGIMSTIENVSFYGRSGLLEGIRSWLERIKLDMESKPFLRQLASQKQEIEKALNKLKDMNGEYFTNSEAEKLKQRLDDLEKQIIENYKMQNIEQKELEQKTEAIKSDIETLKKNVDILNKPNWFKSLASRSFKWIKDPANQQLLKTGADVVSKFLPKDAGVN